MTLRERASALYDEWGPMVILAPLMVTLVAVGIYVGVKASSEQKRLCEDAGGSWTTTTSSGVTSDGKYVSLTSHACVMPR